MLQVTQPVALTVVSPVCGRRERLGGRTALARPLGEAFWGSQAPPC